MNRLPTFEYFDTLVSTIVFLIILKNIYIDANARSPISSFGAYSAQFPFTKFSYESHSVLTKAPTGWKGWSELLSGFSFRSVHSLPPLR